MRCIPIFHIVLTGLSLSSSILLQMQVVLGTLLASLVPVVGFNAVMTSEHFASFLVSWLPVLYVSLLSITFVFFLVTAINFLCGWFYMQTLSWTFISALLVSNAFEICQTLRVSVTFSDCYMQQDYCIYRTTSYRDAKLPFILCCLSENQSSFKLF